MSKPKCAGPMLILAGADAFGVASGRPVRSKGNLIGPRGVYCDKNYGAMKPVYEGNQKHKAPWQSGRKGSLCPSDITIDRARELLQASMADGRKRYSVDKGRAFCAQQHDAAKNRWHGYPVGWKEVPAEVRQRLMESGVLTAREVKRHWEDIQ